MFDIGFPELILVCVVSLLVIGPDKLPDTIRTIALWLGRLKKNFSDFKTEIESEIGADDIRRQLHNESILKDLKEAGRHLNNTIEDTKQELNEIKDPLSAFVKSSETDSGKKDTLDNHDA